MYHSNVDLQMTLQLADKSSIKILQLVKVREGMGVVMVCGGEEVVLVVRGGGHHSEIHFGGYSL